MTEPNNQDDLFADGLVTVREACEFLGVGRTTVCKLMSTGQLRFVKVLNAVRIPKRALMDFAKANLKGGWKSA